MADGRQITVALAGNPNSGKSTIFNAITGGRQHVGNYPGVTVEKKTGRAVHNGAELQVVDLPGTYSLTAYSIEEVIARNSILDEKPDVVIDIVDSSNLERNLYLATQVMELGAPLLLAFNKSDLAEARGMAIDVEKLSRLLGVPIVRTVGHKGAGIRELLDAALAVAADPASASARQNLPHYGRELDPEVSKLAEMVPQNCRRAGRDRWVAVKLLENDAEAIKRLRAIMPADEFEKLLAAAAHSRRHVESVCGDSAEIILADRRYGFISGACQESVRSGVEARHALSDRIDAVVTSGVFGLPLFVLLMLLVFQFTFSLGGWLTGQLDAAKELLSAGVSGLWPAGADSPLRSLLADGIIEGVGTVLSFVPMIFLLFLAISVLEDSGYMARAAFIVDRFMHKIGLHGKSFIPMLIGFGCNVPGILATRTLESRRDRLTTMLILPLMSCSARLPIYVLILGAFFPRRAAFSVFGLAEVSNQALWLLGIYLTGILLAGAAARLLRGTILRGEAGSFVMELPPYRMPTLRGVLVHTWQRGWMFLRKAGTVILAAVIVLWALTTWPKPDEEHTRRFDAQRLAAESGLPAGSVQAEQTLRAVDAARREAELEHSAIGRIGRAIQPVMAPCGFDWKISTALIAALPAKEVFVAQMGVLHAVGAGRRADQPLTARLRAAYSPLQGISIMLFCLVSLPCIPTLAATWQESGSWKWALVQVAGLTALAWLIATAVYQIGSLVVS